MKRYPHTGTIIVERETTDQNGYVRTEEERTTVEGRYEPANQNRWLDQSSKFFCQRLDVLEDNPRALDGQRMDVLGATMGITRAHNYQMHCEIWLD